MKTKTVGRGVKTKTVGTGITKQVAVSWKLSNKSLDLGRSAESIAGRTHDVEDWILLPIEQGAWKTLAAAGPSLSFENSGTYGTGESEVYDECGDNLAMSSAMSRPPINKEKDTKNNTTASEVSVAEGNGNSNGNGNGR